MRVKVLDRKFQLRTKTEDSHLELTLRELKLC